MEANILEKVHRLDFLGVSKCVKLVEHFAFTHFHDKHYAMIFEPLGKSLYAILKENHYQGKTISITIEGFQISLVKLFAIQLFQCLAFLHSIGLTHTDLKVYYCYSTMLNSLRTCF